jgi:hypothetical protein
MTSFMKLTGFSANAGAALTRTKASDNNNPLNPIVGTGEKRGRLAAVGIRVPHVTGRLD